MEIDRELKSAKITMFAKLFHLFFFSKLDLSFC